MNCSSRFWGWMDLIGPMPDHASQTVAALEKRGVARSFSPKRLGM